MPRFFIHSKDIKEGQCRLTGEDFHHLAHVRRTQPGTVISLSDERERLYSARVERYGKDCVEIKIIKLIDDAVENDKRPPFISVYAALLKGKNFDHAIQRLVEVGVSRIVPVITDRTVSLPRDPDKKHSRWQSIVREAAKQSLRRSLPEISSIVSFADIIKENNSGVRIIAHPGAGKGMKELLRSLPRPESVSLLIGPEGGFSGDELNAAEHAGWKAVNFGFSQMRAVTAVAVLAAILIYEWSEEDEDTP